MTILLADMNAETFDLNRHKFESIPEYIKRVMNDNITTRTNCMGMEEMAPANYARFNACTKTFKDTYYFAMSTGDRSRIRAKQKDVFNEPKKYLKGSIGFNLDAR